VVTTRCSKDVDIVASDRCVRSRCHTEGVRRLSVDLVVASIVLVGVRAPVATAAATATPVPTCAASSVRFIEHSTLSGAGNINDLFWIRNVSAQTCSLSGYVRVAFDGVYGIATPYQNPRRLAVSETYSYGRDGNDIGGLKKGLALPTVTLTSRGGVASFWLYGRDEPAGNPPNRCIDAHAMVAWLPGSSRSVSVQLLRANGFFWCGGFRAHPVVPGESGFDPAMPPSYYS